MAMVLTADWLRLAGLYVKAEFPSFLQTRSVIASLIKLHRAYRVLRVSYHDHASTKWKFKDRVNDSK